MTDTEKILDLLEINEQIPCSVVDQENHVVSVNSKWAELISPLEIGSKISKLFDKNTGLLVENSLIDAMTFNKIQRRNVSIKIDDSMVEFRLLLSSFRLNSKTYVYVVLLNESMTDNYFTYPTNDDNYISVRFEKLIKQLQDTTALTLISKKNIQYEIDSISESIAIKNKSQFLFTNNKFRHNFNINKEKQEILSSEIIIDKSILEIIKFAEDQLFILKSPFAIEQIKFNDSEAQERERIILFPILNKEFELDKIIFAGELDLSSHDVETPKIKIDENYKTGFHEEKQINDLSQLKLPTIIYDKNNFDILDANKEAAELYNYDIEQIKEINITQLFLPEDMQEIIMPANDNGKYIYQQVRSDGSKIEVNVERKDIIWNEHQARIETIYLNQPEEEVIELEEYDDPKSSSPNSAIDLSEKIQDIPDENISDFLSSLFHELLTPVNVILGFVQEIIDSIDNPTEEQEESAQIIKDNQQVLLHAMNTAVQYAQLEEHKINLTVDEFDINNHLVDLQDSFSRISDKENVKAVFESIPDSLVIKHDRSKLLAAISYFIKFAIKLTDSKSIFISMQLNGNEVYVLLKDSVKGISENVSENLLEIYNTLSLNSRKNYGISPITVKLAKKLNDLLGISVKEHIGKDGVKSIALITPIVFEKQEPVAERKPIIEKVEPIEETMAGIDEEIVKEDSPVDDSIIPVPVEIKVEKPENIANREVDAKIVEDIAEEEEIITEEIATVESKNYDSFDLSNLSCLFIDDNVDTQLLFKSQMKDFKLLKVCSNFTEAIPLLTKHKFDLVIVDVNLNDTYNGLDALKIIRQFDNYESIPIIAVTAYSFEGDREKFINFGFTDYLTKPIFREHVLKSLEVIIL